MINLTLNLPQTQQHKGQNGKLLIVGGSELFHGASLWSAQIAAHLVDMVFYASNKENNCLVKNVKNNFQDGIVIERSQVLEYAEEADVILLGPGLMRVKKQTQRLEEIFINQDNLTDDEWQNDTYLVTNFLLKKFPEKKFVLDAGALQMLEVDLLTPNCLLTPHQLELKQLNKQAKTVDQKKKLAQALILSKRTIDQIWHNEKMLLEIKGGNAGLTKGGSGDALAGLAAGLYCYNDAFTAAIWASQTVKKAAETLYIKVGPFFTTTELVKQIPQSLWQLIQASKIEKND